MVRKSYAWDDIVLDSMEDYISDEAKELDEFKKFTEESLDPLRACCDAMGQEFIKLEECVQRAEAVHKTIDSHSKDLNDTSSALAGELDKASILTDSELSWLKARDLIDLDTTASSATRQALSCPGSQVAASH